MENSPERDETAEEKDQGNQSDEQNDSKETQTRKPKKERLRNLVAFYAFGALIYTVYSVIISGAQDILAGTFIPTAAVLVTNVGPYFLVTMIAPYFIHRVPYVVRIVAIYALFTAGLFIIVYAKEVYLKLVGICTTSLGAGIGEVSFFTLTAYYEKVTVAAYSAGTGSGFILGPLYYTGRVCCFCKPFLLRYCFALRASTLIFLKADLSTSYAVLESVDEIFHCDHSK